ncbi:hypothetical protein JYT90_00635, partial [bacterium AH-315-P07]|nr:hypothetical protein [bacterium AH-315-P07]
FQDAGRVAPAESKLTDGLLTRVTETLRSKELTTSMVLIAMGISLILGMGHAFSPGHFWPSDCFWAGSERPRFKLRSAAKGALANEDR